MANSYTHMTVREAIPCSEEDFARLEEYIERDRMNADENDTNGSDLVAALIDGQLQLHDDCGAFDADGISEQTRRVIGEIVGKAGKDHWLWDYATTCDKSRVGSHGGGSMRITKDGIIEWPDTVWGDGYRHYIVSGRIPWDGEDTALYVKVPKALTEVRWAADAYIRKLYRRRGREGELAYDVIDAEGYVTVNEDTGESWAHINLLVEIPGEPLLMQGR